jgi:hypothetical protein
MRPVINGITNNTTKWATLAFECSLVQVSAWRQDILWIVLELLRPHSPVKWHRTLAYDPFYYIPNSSLTILSVISHST